MSEIPGVGVASVAKADEIAVASDEAPPVEVSAAVTEAPAEDTAPATEEENK